MELDEKQVLEAALCLLTSPDSSRKRQALALLGEPQKFFGYIECNSDTFREVVEEVIPLLEDEDPEVRYDAVNTLGKLGKLGSREAFRALIEKEEKEKVKTISIRIKRWVGTKESK